MLPAKRFVNSSACPPTPFTAGLPTGSLGPSGVQAVAGCISNQTLTRCSDVSLCGQKRKCATPASLLRSKKATSSAKDSSSEQLIPITNSSPTLAAGSTSGDADLRPFWNKYTRETSAKLWSCTKTDCVDLGTSSWNLSAQKLLAGSWFTTKVTSLNGTTLRNSQKTCSPSSMFSLPETTVCVPNKTDANENVKKATNKKKKETKAEDTTTAEKTPAGKAHKIRVYPNREQRATLKRWFDTARWTYNQCVSAVQKDNVKRAKKELRAVCVNNCNFTEENKWVTETPYDIRDEAMNDLLKAYQTNFALKRKQFTIKYKSKKSPQDSIALLAKHYKSRGIFHPTCWGNVPLKSSEPLPDKLEYDARIMKTRHGQFYLCIPMPLDVKAMERTSEANRVIALDPGVRTFCTGYDPSGMMLEFGVGDIQRIHRLCFVLDKLVSKTDQKTTTHAKRYRYKKAQARIRKKIRDLVDEFHKKTSTYLCRNYDTILLPTFETQQMSRRGHRRISSKSVRAMLTWSHYRFRTRLINKTREHPRCQVILCNEAYTSKTCSECGHLHPTLGSSKTFKCPACSQTSDRDYNAARNILLRFLNAPSPMALSPTSMIFADCAKLAQDNRDD